MVRRSLGSRSSAPVLSSSSPIAERSGDRGEPSGDDAAEPGEGRRMARSASATLKPPDRHRSSFTLWVASLHSPSLPSISSIPLRIMRWTSKRSSSEGTKGSQKSFGEDWGMNMIDETVFDSPLQESISLLSGLGAHVEALNLKKEADTVRRVLNLLHSKELHNTKSLKDLIAAGDVQVDQQLMDWLVQMEWLPKGPGADDAAKSSDTHSFSEADSSRQVEGSVTIGSGTIGSANSTRVLVPLTEEISRPGRTSTARASALLAPVVLEKILPPGEEELLHLLENGVREWEFDTLRLHQLSNGHPLCALGWALFHRTGVRTALGVSADACHAFLRKVEAAYRDVPYHNAAHGACVCHGVWWLLAQNAELQGVITEPLDMFTALLAALVHDVNHDGRNNAFHVASSSELALRYSDQSVLEMHHLATGFSILHEPECRLLQGLAFDVRKELRTRVIGMVLATDLANNFTTINQFKTMLSEHNITEGPPPVSACTSTQSAAAAAPASDLPLPSRQGSAASASGSGALNPAAAQRHASREDYASPSRSAVLPRSTRDLLGAFSPATARRSTISGPPGELAARLPRTRRESGARLSTSGPRGDTRHSCHSTNASSAGSHSGGIALPLPLFSSRADAMSAAERLLILKMVIKCADIGNVTKGQAYCLAWTDRVVQEFFEQGDAEKRLQLPVTPMMDREKASVPKQQIGFYNFVVKPMYEALAMLVPLDRQFENLETVMGYWRGKLPSDEELPAVTLPPRPTEAKPDDVRADILASPRGGGGEGSAASERRQSRLWPTRKSLMDHKVMHDGRETLPRKSVAGGKDRKSF